MKAPHHRKVAIVGGGAAGFFAALRLAALRPQAEVHIFEKSNKLLSKVKVSGGGRCNVTHACFDPRELVNYYPRGQKQLRGPFSRFSPADTVSWFEERGLQLKTEADGRMFPVSDSSQSIIDLFLEEAKKYKVRIHTSKALTGLERAGDHWKLRFNEDESMEAAQVMLAAGSSEKIWSILAGMGLKIVAPVPSLFTFHIRDKALQGLSGTSVDQVDLQWAGTTFKTQGPLLFTHWGISGPSVLKLSAWAARDLHDVQYTFLLRINFIPGMDRTSLHDTLSAMRKTYSRKQLASFSPFPGITKRLWMYLLARAGITETLNWADLSKKALIALENELMEGQYPVVGKSTFKDEFVTCGGVDLSEIDFKTYGAKALPGLFFGGELIDVDALTGGFNFQHAWTSAWIAAGSMAEGLPVT
ncbi:MAG: NAD(P)/FAD-dependent oxidoreductase [Bacteroidia bacterium]|nr:NAD(P)/FAD-dependent oxidoreductase [Bacteroidia bacterium]